MHQYATVVVTDDPCPDGLLGLDLAKKHLPLGKYTRGTIHIPLTHPVTDGVRQEIYWNNGDKTNRLIFIDCCLEKLDIIELASYYDQIIICDHHNKLKFKGFVWPENVIAYIDESLCGSENFFQNVLLPLCPGLKRPLALDIVRIADLAIRDPIAIAALLGQDKIDALGLGPDKLKDLPYILVSALDASIDFTKSYKNLYDNPLTDLKQFQALSLKQIVAIGMEAYPRLKAEAHQLLSNPLYIPIDLPGLGPFWARFIPKNLHENRFVGDGGLLPEYGDLTLIGGKRRNGIYYLSIRMSIGGRAEQILNAEKMAEYLRKNAFRIEANGEKKVLKFSNGGGRGPVGCLQCDPRDARDLLSLQHACKEGDPKLKASPLLYAGIRQDRAIDMNGEEYLQVAIPAHQINNRPRFPAAMPA